ncbi:hypothetical protein ACFRMQ_19085 [Kitasatospora sp. NPDC056783]|uniref:hypothetical protein n=1 Tax=Kitasatospora sp. NPDC056783 TaxID=3345943 RepID=UPI00367C791C
MRRRRLVTTIGTLTAAGLLAVTVPTSAHAATGVLTFYNVMHGNGQGNGPAVAYTDPAPGCHRTPRDVYGPLWGARNETDSKVRFYSTVDCSGGPLFSVSAGSWVRFNSNPGSFSVDS